MIKDSNTYLGVKEIARRANVSIATVDRVMHNRGGVSQKTKAKILEIIKEINYQPNILASRLASRKVINLAVLIPSVSVETPFWEAPLIGIQRAEEELKGYGIGIHYFFFELNDKKSFSKLANDILLKNWEGVLLSAAFLSESQVFTLECHRKKIPFVLIDTDIPEVKSLSYIGPPLFQSGYVAAKLLTYRAVANNTILVVNISKEIENNNHLIIEDGLRKYLSDHFLPNTIVRVDIQDTDAHSISLKLSIALNEHPDTDAILVTNSRVFSVAVFLEKLGKQNLRLVGYDFLKANTAFLANGTIDFLICHKPEEQGYRGIRTLFQKLVLDTPVEKQQFMPIDIISKENMAFYEN